MKYHLGVSPLISIAVITSVSIVLSLLVAAWAVGITHLYMGFPKLEVTYIEVLKDPATGLPYLKVWVCNKGSGYAYIDDVLIDRIPSSEVLVVHGVAYVDTSTGVPTIVLPPGSSAVLIVVVPKSRVKFMRPGTVHELGFATENAVTYSKLFMITTLESKPLPVSLSGVTTLLLKVPPKKASPTVTSPTGTILPSGDYVFDCKLIKPYEVVVGGTAYGDAWVALINLTTNKVLWNYVADFGGSDEVTSVTYVGNYVYATVVTTYVNGTYSSRVIKLDLLGSLVSSKYLGLGIFLTDSNVSSNYLVITGFNSSNYGYVAYLDLSTLNVVNYVWFRISALPTRVHALLVTPNYLVLTGTVNASTTTPPNAFIALMNPSTLKITWSSTYGSASTYESLNALALISNYVLAVGSFVNNTQQAPYVASLDLSKLSTLSTKYLLTGAFYGVSTWGSLGIAVGSLSNYPGIAFIDPSTLNINSSKEVTIYGGGSFLSSDVLNNTLVACGYIVVSTGGTEALIYAEVLK